MDLVLWRDSFLVGNETIDEQHKNLVKLINELYHTLGLKDKNKISQIFTELFKYTISHFSAEERITNNAAYPDFNNHRQEHQGFVKKLNELKARLDKGDAQVRLETINFLKDWLLNHIICVDKKAFDEIKKGS